MLKGGSLKVEGEKGRRDGKAVSHQWVMVGDSEMYIQQRAGSSDSKSGGLHGIPEHELSSELLQDGHLYKDLHLSEGSLPLAKGAPC